jgi:hypothetical protein
MKYTLDSQAYNDIFKTAQEKFDSEMIKREKTVEDMAKKLMIINYTNEFINNKIDRVNAGIYYNNKLKVFENDASGLYDQYGYMVHPKFKSSPIDIFNLRLNDGTSMFKNSLICKINNIENSKYINLLVNETSPYKEILFDEMIENKVTISYEINKESKISLGTMRFNVIEIDPYISGAYNIDRIEIYTMDTNTADIAIEPNIVIQNINEIGKTRIILDRKAKFSKVVFTFSVNFESEINLIKIYPFGLKHIHFYEANFLEASSVILPIYSNDYFEYIYNDIVLYSAEGKIESTAEYYGIEFYTDYEGNTLTGRIYTSSDAQNYRIVKNTKTIYAKVPLLWKNTATNENKYLSLTGILFNYSTEENILL